MRPQSRARIGPVFCDRGATEGPAKETDGPLTVAESHRILADEIRLNGRCYAKNPTMVHAKNQHAPVELLDGWYSVRVAREADAWNFAERIATEKHRRGQFPA